jgi:hypothetical protein
MLKKIAIVVVGLIVALLLFATTRPDTFRVERSVSIKAPAEKIYPLVDDFRRWPSWSPWEKLDPNMKHGYSGPASGEGAVTTWEGNSDVGAGRMEIVESTPPARIVIQLDFLKPFEARNTAEFVLRPTAEATNVVWAMHGPMPYISKLMCIFVSMDKMIGKDFEKGLANLKSVAET